MASNLLVVAILATGVGVAAAIDLRTRRVPNGLTLSLSAAGLCTAAAGLSGISLLSALLGFALGATLMLPGYIFGATGAGDVKLMAAAGTLIGAPHVITAFLYAAIAGGVLALIIAARRRRLAPTVTRATRLAFADAGAIAEVEHPRADNRFAYAPAIAVGTMLAAFGL